MVGAQLLVIIDNVNESESQLQLMADSHTGEVDIPVIMINRLDGLSFIKYLESKDERDSVVI